jgi:hypothetical protein
MHCVSPFGAAPKEQPTAGRTEGFDGPRRWALQMIAA